MTFSCYCASEMVYAIKGKVDHAPVGA